MFKGEQLDFKGEEVKEKKRVLRERILEILNNYKDLERLVEQAKSRILKRGTAYLRSKEVRLELINMIREKIGLAFDNVNEDLQGRINERDIGQELTNKLFLEINKMIRLGEAASESVKKITPISKPGASNHDPGYFKKRVQKRPGFAEFSHPDA